MAFDYEVREEGALLYDVYEIPYNGKARNRVGGQMRLYGRVMVNGVEYELDKDVRVILKKRKNARR